MKWIVFLLLLPLVFANGLIYIVDYEYVPRNVTIEQGQTVSWINNATTRHQVKLVLLHVTSPLLEQHQMFSYTFTDSGEYQYQSSILPAAMRGTIKVVPIGSLPPESECLNCTNSTEEHSEEPVCCPSCSCTENRCPDLNCTSTAASYWWIIGVFILLALLAYKIFKPRN